MASQNASVDEQMQLIQVDPVRRNISLALTQIVVWPFIYLIFLMLLIFSKKETFRTETRYILFGHSLLMCTQWPVRMPVLMNRYNWSKLTLSGGIFHWR
ncbi:unnamed protein product [Leuciscus chuanchicus]